MACYYPLTAYRSLLPGHGVTFRRSSHSGEPLSLPCSRCIGCRIDRANAWAVRLMHEKQMHADSMFLTLTYDDEHLPASGSLMPKHFTDFMKRYRRQLEPLKLRYFVAGEYGEQFGRPHYHALIFGHEFRDKTFLKVNAQGDRLYSSAQLRELWPHGGNSLGDVTYESANYCARYLMKKVTGDRAAQHYQRVDPNTGECFVIEPEYCRMSRNPGIGSSWLKAFGGDVFPADHVVLPDGREGKVPQYYVKKLETENPGLHRVVLRARRKAAKAYEKTGEKSYYRLVARETVKKAALSTLKRNLE